MSDRQKTAIYRKCVFESAPPSSSSADTLEDLLRKASNAVPKPWERKIGAGAEQNQVMPLLISKNTCLCGEVVAYEKGAKIRYIGVDGKNVIQGASRPVDHAGRQRDPGNESILFAVRENHVAFIQSKTVRISELLDYWVWFVQTRASLIPKQMISLENIPAKSALQKIKDHQFRGIQIGGKLCTMVKEPYVQEDGKAPNRRKKFTYRAKFNDYFLGLLRAAGVADPILEDITKSDDPGKVDVDVHISYRSRTEKESKTMLRSLAATLGAQEDISTSIKLSGKSSIEGDELTVRGVISVQCPDGCISVDDGLTKLSAWLAERIKLGEVL